MRDKIHRYRKYFQEIKFWRRFKMIKNFNTRKLKFFDKYLWMFNDLSFSDVLFRNLCTLT